MADITNAQLEELTKEFKRFTDITSAANKSIGDNYVKFDTSTKAVVVQFNNLVKELSKLPTSIGKTIAAEVKKVSEQNTKSSSTVDTKTTTTINETVTKISTANKSLDSFSKSLTTISSVIDNLVKKATASNSKPISKTSDELSSTKKSKGSFTDLGTTVDQTTKRLTVATSNIDSFSNSINRATATIDNLVKSNPVTQNQPLAKKPRKEEKPVDNKKSIGAIDELTTTIRGTTTTIESANKSLESFSSGVTRAVGAIDKLVGETTIQPTPKKNKNKSSDFIKQSSGVLDELMFNITTTNLNIVDVNKSLELLSSTIKNVATDINNLSRGQNTPNNTPLYNIQSNVDGIAASIQQSPGNNINDELKLSKSILHTFSTELERSIKVIKRLASSLTNQQAGVANGEQNTESTSNAIINQLRDEVAHLRNFIYQSQNHNQHNKENKRNKKDARPSELMERRKDESYEAFIDHKERQQEREHILEKGMASLGNSMKSAASGFRSLIPMKTTGIGAMIGKILTPALAPLAKWLTKKAMAGTVAGGGVISKVIDLIGKFGWAFKTAGAIVGVVATILTKWVGSALQHNEAMNASYETLSKFGAIDSTGIQKLVQTAHSAGFTVEQLDKFGVILERERATLALFGGTVANGARQVASMFNTTLRGELEQTYHALGYTTEEAFETYTQYVGIMAKYGKVEGRRQTELALGASNLVKEMDLLSKITGMTRKEQMESLQKRTMDLGFRNFRASLSEGVGETVDSLLTAAEAMGPEFATGLRHLLQTGGAATTEASKKVIRDLGTEGFALIQGVLGGTLDQYQAIPKMASAVKPMLEQVSEMVRLGVDMSNYSALIAQSADAAKQLNLTPDEIKKLKEDQRAQIKMDNDSQRMAEGLRRQAERALTQTMDELNQSMGLLVSKTMPHLLSGFNELARGVAKVLTKLGFDIDMSKFDTREDLAPQISKTMENIGGYQSWITIAEEYQKLKNLVTHTPKGSSEREIAEAKLQQFEKDKALALSSETWKKDFAPAIAQGLLRYRAGLESNKSTLEDLTARYNIAQSVTTSAADLNRTPEQNAELKKLQVQNQEALSAANRALAVSETARQQQQDPVGTLLEKLKLDPRVTKEEIDRIRENKDKWSPTVLDKEIDKILEKTNIAKSFEDYKAALHQTAIKQHEAATKQYDIFKQINDKLEAIKNNTTITTGNVDETGATTMGRNFNTNATNPPNATEAKSAAFDKRPFTSTSPDFTPSAGGIKSIGQYPRIVGDSEIVHKFKQTLGTSESPSYLGYNTGTLGGSKNLKSRELQDFITYREYKRRSKLPGDHPDRIFAYGRYQFTPESLATIANNNPKLLNDTTVLDDKTQELLFPEYVKSRPKLNKLLYGNKPVTAADIEKGMVDAAGAWAVLKTPSGRGQYDQEGVNKATIPAEKLRNVFETELSKKGQLAKHGGIFDGPESGYPVLLHGNEAVIPLENPSKKLVDENVTKKPLEKPTTPEPTPVKTVDTTYSSNNQLLVLMEKMVTTIDDKLSDILIQLSRSKNIQEQQLQHMRH